MSKVYRHSILKIYTIFAFPTITYNMKEYAVNVRANEGEEPIMLLLQRTFSQGVNCLTLNSFGIRPMYSY